MSDLRSHNWNKNYMARTLFRLPKQKMLFATLYTVDLKFNGQCIKIDTFLGGGELEDSKILIFQRNALNV